MYYTIRYGWVDNKEQIVKMYSSACFSDASVKYRESKNKLKVFYFMARVCKNYDIFFNLVAEKFKNIKVSREYLIEQDKETAWGSRKETIKEFTNVIIRVEFPDKFNHTSRYIISLILGHIFRTGNIYERCGYIEEQSKDWLEKTLTQTAGGHNWFNGKFDLEWLKYFDDPILMNKSLKGLTHFFYGGHKPIKKGFPFYCSAGLRAILKQVQVIENIKIEGFKGD